MKILTSKPGGENVAGSMQNRSPKDQAYNPSTLYRRNVVGSMQNTFVSPIQQSFVIQNESTRIMYREFPKAWERDLWKRTLQKPNAPPWTPQKPNGAIVERGVLSLM